MKKKIVTLMLAGMMSISVIACGGTETSDSSNQETTEGATTDSKEETATESEEVTTTKSEEVTVASTEITLAEQEVYNDNGIVVTVTGIDTNSMWGADISVLVENNSDQNITVQTRNGCINGYMMDFQMSCDVAAGKKATDSITIMSKNLEVSGVDTISSIEFALTMFNSDSWDDIATSDTISLTTSATDYVQKYDDSGDVIYDENGIKIVSKGTVEDEIWGPEVVLYIENNTDTAITVQPRDTSINGFMVDASMSSDITAGKRVVDEITFLTDDLDTNGITEIEELETSFAIFNMESWEDIVTTGPITISFK